MWIFFQVLGDRGTKGTVRGAAGQDGEKVCEARRSDSNCECHLNKAVLEERFCGVGLRDPGDVPAGPGQVAPSGVKVQSIAREL